MNQERSLQTNTYGRKQDQTQMHQLPKTRFCISIVKTRTLTKTKNTERPIENIHKTTNKLYVVATKRLHITCLQMKPCTTTSNRRKEQLQLELICCSQQGSDSSYPVLRIESCHQNNANLDVQLATTSAAEQKKKIVISFSQAQQDRMRTTATQKKKKKHQHPTIRRESLS